MAWWYEILQDAKAVVPTVVGGLIAAITGYCLAHKASKETLKRDRVSRLENQKAAALRAVVKLLSIVNGMATLHRQLEGMICDADAQGHSELSLWQKVKPIIGFTDHSIRFEAEEVAVFVAKEVDYANELLLLADRYATLESAFRTYERRRAELTDDFPATTTMIGAVGTTFFTEEQGRRVAPRAAELNTMVEELRRFASEDYETALRLAEQFGRKARVQLNDPNFPLLDVEAARAEKTQINVDCRTQGTRA